tara:strand:+ start:2017 stop:2415 length:399 start_codon:yes stop_codon:yes gene_type:complete
MKNNIEKNEYNSLLYIFSKNFLYGGIVIGICLTLLELIKYNKNLVGFYAFGSASFFIVNLFQFYYIDKINPEMSYVFLYHTVIGGILWVLYSVMLYILYLKRINTYTNILFTTIIITITWTIYYILLIKKII